MINSKEFAKTAIQLIVKLSTLIREHYLRQPKSHENLHEIIILEQPIQFKILEHRKSSCIQSWLEL